MATINWQIELLRDVTLDSNGNGEFVARLKREGVVIDPNYQFVGKPTAAQDAARAKMVEYETQLKEAAKFRTGQIFNISITV